jgi:hypothetical protein
MGCRLTVKLLTEHQEGNIGSDWRYVLDVKAFNQGIAGKGKIKVRKHQLDSGETQEPFGSPEPLVIDVGDCKGELDVTMTLTATEVDLFINDKGTIDKAVSIRIPEVGDPPAKEPVEISVGVRESPGLLNEVAIFTLTAELSLSRD